MDGQQFSEFRANTNHTGRSTAERAQGTVLNTLFSEMKQHAAAAERTLHELAFDLRQRTEEAERLRAHIRNRGGTAPAAPLSPTALEVRAISAARASYSDVHNHNTNGDDYLDDSASIADQTALHATLRLARERIVDVERDISRDADDRLRCLRAIERAVHGGAQPTLADYTVVAAASRRASSRPRGAQRLVAALQSLPAENVALLSATGFFEFANTTLRAASEQRRRSLPVDVIGASFVGLQHVGLRPTLVETVASMTVEDMLRL